MARFRQIHKKIWKDPDFQEMTPENKIVFIYLFTNECASESGIYPVTARTIALETGIDLEEAQKALSNGHMKNIHYDNTNRIIFVRNFRKYNKGGSPGLIDRAIAHEFETTKESDLWLEFCKEYPEYINLLITVDKQFRNRLATFDKGLLDLIYDDIDNSKSNINGKGKGKEGLSNGLETVGKELGLEKRMKKMELD